MEWCALALIFSVFLPLTLIQAATPEHYYDSAVGKTGSELKTALYNIIKGHTEYPYTSDNPDVWDALKDVDEDPNNSDNLILLYTGRSQAKILNSGETTSSDNNLWNREHVWAKSHGDFGTTMGPGTDIHHLRPADESVNSTRNNLDFDNGGVQHEEATECYYDSDSWEPRDAVKGDIARMIFYMAIRYEGEGDEPDLEVVDSVYNWSVSDPTRPYHGKLSSLLQWHANDPVDDWERSRNDKIYTNWQHNRNPFIDHPEYVALIDWNVIESGRDEQTLSVGDIVIIGVNCDDPDDFAFMPLVDLNAGTTINFTDNGWKSTNEFYPNEGYKIYTAPSAVSAGTVIVYSVSSANFTSGGGSFSLSSSGDQIIAYQGNAASPTMLFAINIEGSAIWQEDVTSSNTSALPLGLTNGSNCVALTEINNVKYDGSVTSGKADVLAAVCNKDNWIGDDDTRYDFTIISDYSLPVELCEFKGIAGDRQVILSWSTESETENLGFNLYRSTSVEPFSVINDQLIPGHGSTSERHEYSYIDYNVIYGVTYYYKIEDVDYSGMIELRDIVVTATPSRKVEDTIVDGFRLLPCFPNPFNPETTLRFELSKAAIVHVQVYDLLGNSVTILTNSTYQPGEYSLRWNGRDAQNRSSASGIYLIHTQSSTGYSHTDKVIFIR